MLCEPHLPPVNSCRQPADPEPGSSYGCKYFARCSANLQRWFSAARGDVNMSAYGDKDMPVWGPVFLAMSDAHPSEVQMRMTNLTKYIESLQEK